jgi:hypothetical protein
MIATALAALLAPQNPLKVEDYFPLTPGLSRIYQEELNSQGKNFKYEVIEEVGVSTKLQRAEKYTDLTELDPNNQEKTRVIEENGITIRTVAEGAPPAQTSYRIENNRVYVVSIDGKSLLAEPYPILALGSSNPTTWLFNGNINVMGAPAPASIQGEAKPTKNYRFQGKDYPAIQCTLKIRIELGFKISTEQKAIYAKGLGLVEYEETGRLENEVTKRKRKITNAILP